MYTLVFVGNTITGTCLENFKKMSAQGGNLVQTKYQLFRVQKRFSHGTGLWLCPCVRGTNPLYQNVRRNEDDMGNKCLDGTALTIAIIGAVNWGLIGLFRFDLVAFLFGDMSWLSRIVYVLVGISGLYLISFFLHLGNSEN